MKIYPKAILSRPAWLFTALITLMYFSSGCKKIVDHLPKLHLTTVASGLKAPMGVETDSKGNIWVAESGTANNDGKVVVIKPTGEVYDAIINLASIKNASSGELEGPAHMLLDRGILYVLAGNYLYSIDIKGFAPGNKPIDAATLSYEDIGSFSLSYPYKNNAHDTHPYNLTKGPNGDLYITDAGANAIIHRKGPGMYAVLAEVPGITNPTPVGPPTIQSVPTSIFYDGHDFLVTTLLGFPFPSGNALIYKISMSGKVNVYQKGLTSLVDIERGNYFGQFVLQHGKFGAKGFEPNTGALLQTNGSSAYTLINGLNMPVGLKQADMKTWYITSLGDGTLLKASYY